MWLEEMMVKVPLPMLTAIIRPLGNGTNVQTCMISVTNFPLS